MLVVHKLIELQWPWRNNRGRNVEILTGNNRVKHRTNGRNAISTLPPSRHGSIFHILTRRWACLHHAFLNKAGKGRNRNGVKPGQSTRKEYFCIPDFNAVPTRYKNKMKKKKKGGKKKELKMETPSLKS